MKYIHELRLGRPKTFKTGAVVRSYPKPMLVLEGDKSGLDIIVPPQKVDFTTFDGIDAFANKPTSELPEILAIDFLAKANASFLSSFDIAQDRESFPAFVALGNKLLKGCPWKTIVIDPLNRLVDIIMSYMAVDNKVSGQLSDPRKWANTVGMKIVQICSTFQKLPCHFVCILHTGAPDKDETTSEVSEEPLLPGRNARGLITGVFGSVFYATIEGGNPVVKTKASGYVKAIGATWPTDLPATCKPLFNDIYGEAVKKGEL